jgi:hypothetical protein
MIEIYSRQKTMPDATYDMVIESLRREGYPVDKLEKSKKTDTQ